MTRVICITDFPVPDETPEHEHCRGQFNVDLCGVTWTVDFDYAEPIVYCGCEDVTDCLKESTLDRIIDKAVQLCKEDSEDDSY